MFYTLNVYRIYVYSFSFNVGTDQLVAVIHTALSQPFEGWHLASSMESQRIPPPNFSVLCSVNEKGGIAYCEDLMTMSPPFAFLPSWDLNNRRVNSPDLKPILQGGREVPNFIYFLNDELLLESFR